MSKPRPTSTVSETNGLADKASRFSARKKQKRVGKRGRSDGFVVGLDLANSSEEEGEDASKKPGLDTESLSFILWLRNPTVQNLSQLRKAIKCNDQDWMRSFLEFDGPEKPEHLSEPSSHRHGPSYDVCVLYQGSG
uniref:Uncharacterized protein n=1 Tax=Arion vulgaris TaxID=1028688 RepID=A0A0B7AHL9_9EUPU